VSNNINKQFISHENRYRTLNNMSYILSVDDITPDKIIHHQSKCYDPFCDKTTNLIDVPMYYINCVCDKCADFNSLTNKFYLLNCDDDTFECSECNVEYSIQYNKDSSNNYLFVNCKNPYEIKGSCPEKTSYISTYVSNSDLCKEIKPPSSYIVINPSFPQNKKKENIKIKKTTQFLKIL